MKLLTILLAVVLCAAILFAQGPVVRSIKFANFEPISIDEIHQAFQAKNVALGVGKAYDAKEVDAAKTALKELLSEKGRTGVSVSASQRAIPPSSVELTFTAVSK